jgi:Raf kinase inhibitor-like YbhB/YbcL family protein
LEPDDQMTFKITSLEFGEGQPLPRRFTCDGMDISPPLNWKNDPAGTISFTLVVNDPDAPAGGWVHWLLFNIPAETRQLAEGIPAEKVLPDGTLQGRNSWHQVRYGGPCPPSGIHHYYFKLYALDCKMKMEGEVERREIKYCLQGHILVQTQLMGIYSRGK